MDLKQLPSVRLNLIRKPSSESIGLTSPSTMTSEPLPLTDSEQTEFPLMSSQEGFPARTYQSRESKQALTENAQDYGKNSVELLAKYDPTTRLWKTCQLSLVETEGDGLAEFSEIWPRSGMTRNGIAYQLPTLAQDI